MMWLADLSNVYHIFKRETRANTTTVFKLHLVRDVQAHCSQTGSYHTESPDLIRKIETESQTEHKK